MAATTSVSSVYVHVIEDVISKVRDEFLNVGVGENVLNELQGLWELKMMQCGAICGPIERAPAPKAAGPITPVHDLNVPYEGPDEYETPTAEMLFPPTPLQTPIQTPLPGIENSLYQLPGGTGEYAPMHENRSAADVKNGRPSPYMQPPSPWMGQRPPLGVDVNVAYVEGRDEVDRGAPNQPLTQDFFMMSSGKRKREDYASHVNQSGYIPQQDGSAGSTLDVFGLEDGQVKNVSDGHSRYAVNVGTPSMQNVKGAPRIPQQDGIHDGFDDLFHLPSVSNEEYNTPVDNDLHATPSVGTPKPNKSEVADDEEPPLNEADDDDDDLDDLEQGEEEPSTHHLVLAQFDKVTRTKSRWKCALKDGIMHINNKDILFNKANGEFEF